jgi:hypothetical protein
MNNGVDIPYTSLEVYQSQLGKVLCVKLDTHLRPATDASIPMTCMAMRNMGRARALWDIEN